jgi:putative PIN family toxin of toxin-antitoxin system
LLEELADVTSRPKLRKFFTQSEWDLILDIIDRYAVYIPVVSDVNVCRDIKDNFLLSLAKDSQADYLITGDNDLLTLKVFEITQILTVAEFQMKMKYIM